MKQTSIISNTSMPILVALLLWSGVALVIGGLGLLAYAPIPPPAIAFGLTALLLLLLWRFPAIRACVRGVGTGTLVAFHGVRLIVGIYFLILFERGVLPGAFAIPAGWGDALVGATALLVLWLCVPVRTPPQRVGLLLWNAAGFIDILLVLSNGVRLFLRDATLGEPFMVLPLALLPLFVVPLVLVTHILLFVWIGGQRPDTHNT